MDQTYLNQLINEVNARSGGLILNLNGRPSAVVLSIEKYNQLIQTSSLAVSGPEAKSEDEQIMFHPKSVLVTGGAGYIGAHVVRQLINAGHKISVIDNLSSGKRENVPAEALFIEGDIGDENLLRDVFASRKFDAVMHLAASIEVEESVLNPVKYLQNNTVNTGVLLRAMDDAGVKNIIFSSTAAVYGDQKVQPISEAAPTSPTNPYGYSKLLAEELISYYCKYRGLKAVILRYFNACGCDFDGKIKPTHESHLLAKVMNVISGQDAQLVVNGSDYETHDGTCLRDYVHVLDIASAHLLALEKVESLKGANIYNVGTGQGVSVLEMVNTAAEVLNRMIPMERGPRRPGDPPVLIADSGKITTELGFKPNFSDLETIVKTAFRSSQG